MFKTVIFNASATVFARNDVLFELLLLCSDLWIHSQNLLSSHYRTASEHHPTSAWVVALCLGLTGWFREKTNKGQAPYVDPAPEKVGVN